MSGSLRKLFTNVWSFLKGVLPVGEVQPEAERRIVHVHSPTLAEGERALAIIQESIGHENVIVLVDPTKRDPRIMLCVRAQEEALKRVFELLPERTPASFEPLTEEMASELATKRMLCEF